MKNLFANLGTKKIAGAVLVGATLLVGIGVVNNFSGDSQKSANEIALSRFGKGAYDVTLGGSSSASRADLERRIAAGQDGYSARFLKGKADGTEPDEALSSDGAYAEGIRGGAGSGYGEGGADGSGYANGDAYQAFGSTYEQDFGVGEYDNAQGNTAFGEKQFQAAQAAAAEAAGQGLKGKAGKNGKGGKGGAQAGGRNVRPATQINKLAASKGGSTFGSGGAGGGSFGGGAGSFGSGSGANGDNNTQVLPKPKMDKATDANAFKFGRAAGMGGFNIGGLSGSEVKGGATQGRGAVNDLYMARMYSNKGAASQQEEGQKSLAEAAFDGSNPDNSGPIIEEGASIAQVASELAKGLEIDVPDPNDPNANPDEPTVEDYIRQEAALKALQEKISNKLLLLIGIVAAAAIGLYFLVKAAYAAPLAWWFWVAAGVLSAAALATIACFMWAGDNSIVNMIKEMGDPEKFGLVNQGIDVGGKLTNTYILAAEMTALLGMCWIPWNSITSQSTIVQKLVGTVATSIVGNVVQSGIQEGVNNYNLKHQDQNTPKP